MIVAAEYSFNRGKEIVEKKYPYLLQEIKSVIAQIDAACCKTKMSKEKNMIGRLLYNPVAFNQEFKKYFFNLNWINQKVKCDYSAEFYSNGYIPKKLIKNAYRDMDFVKGRLGVEVQFGKYSFMVYNVCAKMTIFKNLNFIDAGVEIVPVKQLSLEMSSGVSFFEQFTWDLSKRGVSNIDIPVLILGIDV